MHNYKLLNDNITMLVNSSFLDDDDVAYVNKHRFNVKFTEVRCSKFVEYILMFKNLGYEFELKTEPNYAPRWFKT